MNGYVDQGVPRVCFEGVGGGGFSGSRIRRCARPRAARAAGQRVETWDDSGFRERAGTPRITDFRAPGQGGWTVVDAAWGATCVSHSVAAGHPAFRGDLMACGVHQKNNPHTESAESTEFSRAARRTPQLVRYKIRSVDSADQLRDRSVPDSTLEIRGISTSKL